MYYIRTNLKIMSHNSILCCNSFTSVEMFVFFSVCSLYVLIGSGKHLVGGGNIQKLEWASEHGRRVGQNRVPATWTS